jgi:hypothetical protein
MTKEELATLLSHTRLRGRARQACELVLVQGKSQADAARIVGTSRETVSVAIKRVREVSEQLKSNTENDGNEMHIINAYHTGNWSAEDDMPACSLSERICVALAIARYDLLPEPWTDPLSAYKTKLNKRQQAIIDSSRQWF